MMTSSFYSGPSSGKTSRGFANELAEMGRSVLRPDKTLPGVSAWVQLDLNPAIWETIAATGLGSCLPKTGTACRAPRKP
jgi:hypothetical protein